MTDERKAELVSLVNEAVESIKNAKTVDELGSALEKMNDSRLHYEDENDAKWFLKLFGRQIGKLQDSELSLLRISVYSIIQGSLVAFLLIDRLAALDDVLANPFDEFPVQE